VVHQDDRHLPEPEPAEIRLAARPVLRCSHQLEEIRAGSS
jgi:hypothetical protein